MWPTHLHSGYTYRKQPLSIPYHEFLCRWRLLLLPTQYLLQSHSCLLFALALRCLIMHAFLVISQCREILFLFLSKNLPAVSKDWLRLRHERYGKNDSHSNKIPKKRSFLFRPWLVNFPELTIPQPAHLKVSPFRA